MPAVTTTTHGTLALLPLQPQAPATETLTWKTDVLESHNGTEQRIQVRALPRQGFSYSFPTQQSEVARALNLLYGSIREEQAIPVWTEAQFIGTVTPGETTLTAVVDKYDFRALSLALLWQSPRQWQVIEIDTVGSGVLNLNSTTISFSAAYLMPLRVGRIRGNGKRKTSGYSAEQTLDFEADDNIAFSPAAPAQYKGEDIYYDEILFDGNSIHDDIVRREDIADFELGLVSVRSPWLNSRIRRPYNKVLEGASEVWQFRQWLHRRAGRYRAFWQPSFENDAQLKSTGTITDKVQIAANDYLTWAQDRKHLAFLSNGVWSPREVLSVAQINPDLLELTLDSTLNLAANSISRISYLGLKRLDTDNVELNWIGAGVCQVSINMLEISP